MKIVLCLILLQIVVLSVKATTPYPPWPPSCCGTRCGCAREQLAPYCVCPELCVGVGKCPCKWPGTGEIIEPRPYIDIPIAPFCSCPVASCFAEPCPEVVKECTPEDVQKLIDL